MNIYNILRKFYHIKSKRFKLLAILLAHIARRRYIGVFFDPVLACNIRCKMCYFSDSEKRKQLHGIADSQFVEATAKAMFNRALKLQIGCGAEPTLYKSLPQIVALGKSHKVPYISITTNGQLLSRELLRKLINNGLNEVTLSLHGITKETYEHFMTGAKFERFKELLTDLKEAKQDFPHFKIRINYVMNHDNTAQLAQFWDLIGETPVDVLQIRPIQHIGESEYTNFDLTHTLSLYDTVITPLIQKGREKGTTIIAPDKHNILNVDENEPEFNALIEELTYYYVSPQSCNKPTFDMTNDTFKSYHSRQKTVSKLLKLIFSASALKSGNKTEKKVTKKQNYNIN